MNESTVERIEQEKVQHLLDAHHIQVKIAKDALEEAANSFAMMSIALEDAKEIRDAAFRAWEDTENLFLDKNFSRDIRPQDVHTLKEEAKEKAKGSLLALQKKTTAHALARDTLEKAEEELAKAEAALILAENKLAYIEEPAEIEEKKMEVRGEPAPPPSVQEPAEDKEPPPAPTNDELRMLVLEELLKLNRESDVVRCAASLGAIDAVQIYAQNVASEVWVGPFDQVSFQQEQATNPDITYQRRNGDPLEIEEKHCPAVADVLRKMLSEDLYPPKARGMIGGCGYDGHTAVRFGQDERTRREHKAFAEAGQPRRIVEIMLANAVNFEAGYTFQERIKAECADRIRLEDQLETDDHYFPSEEAQEAYMRVGDAMKNGAPFVDAENQDYPLIWRIGRLPEFFLREVFQRFVNKHAGEEKPPLAYDSVEGQLVMTKAYAEHVSEEMFLLKGKIAAKKAVNTLQKERQPMLDQYGPLLDQSWAALHHAQTHFMALMQYPATASPTEMSEEKALGGGLTPNSIAYALGLVNQLISAVDQTKQLVGALSSVDKTQKGALNKLGSMEVHVRKINRILVEANALRSTLHHKIHGLIKLLDEGKSLEVVQQLAISMTDDLRNFYSAIGEKMKGEDEGLSFFLSSALKTVEDHLHIITWAAGQSVGVMHDVIAGGELRSYYDVAKAVPPSPPHRPLPLAAPREDGLFAARDPRIERLRAGQEVGEGAVKQAEDVVDREEKASAPPPLSVA